MRVVTGHVAPVVSATGGDGAQPGPPMRRKNVDVVFFDAGSGHRTAAHALATALRQDRPHWRTRAIDLLDVVRGHPLFSLTMRAGIARFNDMLRRDAVVDLPGLIRLCLLCHDLVTPVGLRRIARFWASARPDALVSVTPMVNELLYRSARRANPAVACVTVPVDFEEVRPRYWFAPGTPQHYLLASDRLHAQARAARIPERRIARLSSMVIDPLFYAPPPDDVPAAIGALGLDPALPTCLVSFGGQGSALAKEVALRLAAGSLRPNMIFLCGRNTRLFAELSAWQAPYRTLVLGFAEQAPARYYRLADVVIGKPGTMTITEAVVTGTPLVLIKSKGMAPVQRGNEAWVRQSGVGQVIASLDEIEPAVARAISGGRRYRERATQHAGRGVFEAAAIITALVEAPGAQVKPSRRVQDPLATFPHRREKGSIQL